MYDEDGKTALLLLRDVNQYMNQVLDEVYKYDAEADVAVGAFDSSVLSDDDFSYKDGVTITDRSHPYNSSRCKTPTRVLINNEYVMNTCKSINGEKYVNAEESIRFLWTCYHEIAHVRLRTREFVRVDASDLIKRIAVNSICSDFLPEYEKQGYYKSPEEVFCERYAFNQMSKFCESQHFDFDWKSMLQNRVKDSHFVSEPIDSYDDIKDIYNQLMDTVFSKSRINGGVRPAGKRNLKTGERDFSLQFKYLRNFHNFDFCSILYERDGMRQANFLAKYIAQHDASCFRQFQCIKADFEQYFNPANRESERIVGDKLLGVKGYKAKDFNRSELFRKADGVDDVNIEGFDDIRNARVAEVDTFDVKDDSNISRTDPTDDW